MIDCENIVFDEVFAAVSTAHPSIDATSVYTESSAEFPHFSLYELDNFTESGSLGNSEISARISFQTDVFSNESMEHAKNIDAIIHDKMISMGFRCSSRQKMPNIDRTVYRITSRYTAEVSQTVDGSGNITFYTFK